MTEDTEKLLNANIAVHKKEADLFKLIHPELFNKTEYEIIDSFILHIKKLSMNNAIEILDVACGTGRLTHAFLSAGFNVTATDLSPDMLKNLSLGIHQDHISLLTTFNGDIDTFISTHTKKYDAITMGAFLHHVNDIHALFDKLKPLLKEGGFLFITHDPALRMRKFVSLGATLEKIDSIFFQLWYLFFKGRLLPRTKAYADAEIHTRYGIDDDLLCTHLTNNGFNIIEHKKYYVHKTRIISLIDRTICKLLPQFYFIARKQIS